MDISDDGPRPFLSPPPRADFSAAAQVGAFDCPEFRGPEEKRASEPDARTNPQQATSDDDDGGGADPSHRDGGPGPFRSPREASTLVPFRGGSPPRGSPPPPLDGRGVPTAVTPRGGSVDSLPVSSLVGSGTARGSTEGGNGVADDGGRGGGRGPPAPGSASAHRAPLAPGEDDVVMRGTGDAFAGPDAEEEGGRRVADGAGGAFFNSPVSTPRDADGVPGRLPIANGGGEGGRGGDPHPGPPPGAADGGAWDYVPGPYFPQHQQPPPPGAIDGGKQEPGLSLDPSYLLGPPVAAVGGAGGGHEPSGDPPRPPGVGETGGYLPNEGPRQYSGGNAQVEEDYGLDAVPEGAGAASPSPGGESRDDPGHRRDGSWSVLELGIDGRFDPARRAAATAADDDDEGDDDDFRNRYARQASRWGLAAGAAGAGGAAGTGRGRAVRTERTGAPPDCGDEGREPESVREMSGWGEEGPGDLGGFEEWERRRWLDPHDDYFEDEDGAAEKSRDAGAAEDRFDPEAAGGYGPPRGGDGDLHGGGMKNRTGWPRRKPGRCARYPHIARSSICALVAGGVASVGVLLWRETTDIVPLTTGRDTIQADTHQDPGAPPKDGDDHVDEFAIDVEPAQRVPPAPFDIAELCSPEKMVESPLAALHECQKACGPSECCYGDNHEKGVAGCLGRDGGGSNSEACRGYTPYCDVLFGVMGPIPAAPPGLWEACDPHHVFKPDDGGFGREVCQDLCHDGFCCFTSAFGGAGLVPGSEGLVSVEGLVSEDMTPLIESLVEGASCFADNAGACGGYGPCLTLALDSDDALAGGQDEGPPAPPADLLTLCAPAGVRTESGMARCVGECLPGSCCLSSDPKLSCAGTHYEACRPYEPCRDFRDSFEAMAKPTGRPTEGVPEKDRLPPPPPPPDLSALCSYESLAEDALRQQCEDECEPGACCIDGTCGPTSTDDEILIQQDDDDDFLGEQVHVCSSYEPCRRLAPLPDPPDGLAGLCGSLGPFPPPSPTSSAAPSWSSAPSGMDPSAPGPVPRDATGAGTDHPPPSPGPSVQPSLMPFSAPPNAEPSWMLSSLAPPSATPSRSPRPSAVLGAGDVLPPELTDGRSGNGTYSSDGPFDPGGGDGDTCADACFPAICCFASGPDECSGYRGKELCEMYVPCLALLKGEAAVEDGKEGLQEQPSHGHVQGGSDTGTNKGVPPANGTVVPEGTVQDYSGTDGEGGG